MIDGKGILSLGSLKLVPAEGWRQGGSYACSDENRSLTAAVSTHTVSTSMLSSSTGKCSSGYYFGVPCLIFLFLLIPSFVILFRKRLARGQAQFPFPSAPQDA
ncbi:hypothetical protein lerEdw1_011517 [Lerista edwardsae]|nr:hypothetical protein lerEdw1_011517 [Lerista edwardsae]